MTLRQRIGFSILLLAGGIPSALALFNLNEGREIIFVTGSYGIGFDSNVFTRATSKSSFTQNASLSADYARQAGLIGVTVNVSVATGSFQSLHGQDFLDPSVAISFRKRYGRTTGSFSLSGRQESQPDPDAGQRTQSINYGASLDLRYPVNDRYYLTNTFRNSSKLYVDNIAFSDLMTYSDSFAVNYVYTSKLDLNGGYTLGISDTSKDTRAYDHSLTVGASGSILPKLSGSIRFGLSRRISESPLGGKESFNAFTSSTSVKWLFSRKLSFNADLTEDFSTTSTDISVNRLSAGLHGNFSLTTKYFAGSGVTYTHSDFLGVAGGGRKDDMFQFSASLGVAFTTHIRMSLAYSYMLNNSNAAEASFERQSLALSAVATY